MHIPAQPWRSPRLCESLISRGIFFLAKPQRALRHAYPQRSLGFSATLREPHFSWDIFSRQAAKGAKACTPPAQPLRSPRLCESLISRGIFFLAKPQRALRHAHPCAALAFSAPLREAFFPRDIFSRQAAKGTKACIPLRAALAFSATPRPYSTASMIQSSMLRWSSEKLMATLYLWRLSSAKALR